MFKICRNVKCILLLALFASFLAIVSAFCRAEGNYQLTTQELTNMKYYIGVIKQEKENLINDLKTCKISLQQAEERRQSLENQLNELQTNYNLLQEERNELVTLSKDLQESFEQSKKEAESRIRKLTIQRNVWAIIGLIVAFL